MKKQTPQEWAHTADMFDAFLETSAIVNTTLSERLPVSSTETQLASLNSSLNKLRKALYVRYLYEYPNTNVPESFIPRTLEG